MSIIRKIISIPIMLYLFFIISLQGTSYKVFMLQYCAIDNPRWNNNAVMFIAFVSIPALVVVCLCLYFALDK